MYGGESDLLRARMEIVKADLTIVCEGNKSFTGKAKEAIKPEPPESYEGSMFYLMVDGETHSDPWHNEFAQRRAAFDALENFDVPDDSVVGLFDVDEIPDPIKLRATEHTMAWLMDKYQMSARWFQQRELTGVSGLYGDLRGVDAAGLRANRGGLPFVAGGWHLSSFLTLDGLIAKWENFSHQELVKEDMAEWVSRCWRDGLAVENGKPLTQIDVLDEMPEAILMGPSYWLRGRNA
jgi:hypothetical protein